MKKLALLLTLTIVLAFILTAFCVNAFAEDDTGLSGDAIAQINLINSKLANLLQSDNTITWYRFASLELIRLICAMASHRLT